MWPFKKRRVAYYTFMSVSCIRLFLEMASFVKTFYLYHLNDHWLGVIRDLYGNNNVRNFYDFYLFNEKYFLRHYKRTIV